MRLKRQVMLLVTSQVPHYSSTTALQQYVTRYSKLYGTISISVLFAFIVWAEESP